MTAALPTYEDYLHANGYVSSGTFSCPACDGPPQPAFAFVKTPEGHEHSFICSTCHITAAQQEKLAEEELQRVARVAADPWDCEDGNAIRAQRNAIIERWRWALDVDTTPLTEDSRLEVAAYVRTLHRITVDFCCPADIQWPQEPTLRYA